MTFTSQTASRSSIAQLPRGGGAQPGTQSRDTCLRLTHAPRPIGAQG